MFTTPDGKTYDTEAEYKDALVCHEWEAGRAARRQELAEQKDKRSSRAMSRADAYQLLPGQIRRRANLRSPRGGSRY